MQVKQRSLKGFCHSLWQRFNLWNKRDIVLFPYLGPDKKLPRAELSRDLDNVSQHCRLVWNPRYYSLIYIWTYLNISVLDVRWGFFELIRGALEYFQSKRFDVNICYDLWWIQTGIMNRKQWSWNNFHHISISFWNASWWSNAGCQRRWFNLSRRQAARHGHHYSGVF